METNTVSKNSKIKNNSNGSAADIAKVPEVRPERAAIVIEGRHYFVDFIAKNVNSYLSDYGRARHLIQKHATLGRVDASLNLRSTESAKAVAMAVKDPAISGLVSDPAKFGKRASALMRLAQALEDLSNL